MKFLCLIFLVTVSSLGYAKEVSKRQTGKIVGVGQKKATITLKEPRAGWTVDRMIAVSGTVSDPSINPISVAINGNKYLVRVSETGSFSRKFPAFPGRNSVLVSGVNAAGNVRAEASVLSKAPTVPITVILTSDTDGIYTDLHIYEPAMDSTDPFAENQKDSAHVYWASTSSPSGGKFFLNEQLDSFDQPGYGPYLYTHVSPPIGIFRIDANYWPSGDKAHVLSTLNIILNAGKVDEVQKTIRAPLAKPGETVTLAWIRYEKGGKAYLYSPGSDPLPKGNRLWPEWVLNFKQKEKPSYGDNY